MARTSTKQFSRSDSTVSSQEATSIVLTKMKRPNEVDAKALSVEKDRNG
jgi:hypothetical protein